MTCRMRRLGLKGDEEQASPGSKINRNKSSGKREGKEWEVGLEGCGNGRRWQEGSGGQLIYEPFGI